MAQYHMMAHGSGGLPEFWVPKDRRESCSHDLINAANTNFHDTEPSTEASTALFLPKTVKLKPNNFYKT